MKNINIVKSFILALTMLCAYSCQSGEEPLSNAVYITEAQTGFSKKVTVDDQGATATLSVRLAMKADQDVNVKMGAPKEVLDNYNKKFGSTYIMLPEHLFTFDNPELLIKKGQIGATALCGIKIKPYDETVNPSEKYAIPVSLASVNGLESLEPAQSIVILLDQVIITNVLKGNSGKIICELPAEKHILNMKAWTLEFLYKVPKYTGAANAMGQNKHVFSFVTVPGGPTSTNMFCRLSELSHPRDEFNFVAGASKVFPTTRLPENTWTHVAWVYNGATYSVYFNGKLDMTYPTATPGIIYNIGTLNLIYGNASYFSEMRYWSVARSQANIEDNMYVVNPKSDGLEVYWKMNEGSGGVAKDYTDNGRDGTIAASVVWESGQRFPADK